MNEPIHKGQYPAFPVPEHATVDNDSRAATDTGMNLRQYAAIHLRVPMSGEAWLDEMIREAQHRDVIIAAIRKAEGGAK